LNRTRKVEVETSERVRAAIEKLGYEVDGVAQSLRVRSTFTFALIIPDLTNPFFPELATVVQHNAARPGYHGAICNDDTPGSASQELCAHCLRASGRRRYDVVLFAETWPISHEARAQLVATGTPVVLISGIPYPQADRVYIDDYRAARDLMAHLIARGHA